MVVGLSLSGLFPYETLPFLARHPTFKFFNDASWLREGGLAWWRDDESRRLTEESWRKRMDEPSESWDECNLSCEGR